MQYYSADFPATFQWKCSESECVLKDSRNIFLNENLSNQFMTHNHYNDVIVIEDKEVVDTISVDLPANFRRNVREPDYFLKEGNNVSLDANQLVPYNHDNDVIVIKDEQVVDTISVDLPANLRRNVPEPDYFLKEGNNVSLDVNQLVPYNHDNDVIVIEDDEDINTPSYEMSSFPIISTPNYSMKVLPSVGTYTIQCASCMKWRIVPSKEKYLELRENFIVNPFYCENAQEWNSDVSCADPPDILQDDSKLWAIDKPNIAKPPPGWDRTVRIRAEGGTKFADVYYAAPTGKMLRSMAEIQKYLLKHPEFTGISMSQFSFKTPRPLQENYVRKRSVGSINANGLGGLGVFRPLDSIQANLPPLMLVGPDPNLEIMEQGTPSAPQNGWPISHTLPGSVPKKKTKKKKSTTLIEQEHYDTVQFSMKKKKTVP